MKVAILAIALTLLSGCAWPTYDKAILASVKAEARALQKAYPTMDFEQVPKEAWPKTIASLKPELVFVSIDGVDILTKPYFDGGWGYFVVIDDGVAPQPEGRYSKLGEGIYWSHPY
ncbi:MAG: hypothetical protein EOP62_17765 [Sphingomonadales bacterium]|nr:MAG: hypothetical protein EOP62_17765 [Sphingomonadales bacterium]